MEAPPKEKMPLYHAVGMVSFALVIDALEFFFLTLAITGPLLVGTGTDIVVSHYVGSTLGHIAGVAVTSVSFLFEFATGGLTAASIALIGSFFATVIGFFGQVVLWGWMMLRGVSFWGEGNLPGRVGLIGITATLNLLPFINGFPWLTGGTFLTVLAVRKEDREKRRAWKKRMQKEIEEKRKRQEAAELYFAQQSE